MLAFVLEHRAYVAVAIVLLVLARLAWKSGVLSGVKLPAFSFGKKNDRLALLGHLDAAYAAFETLGCHEGMAGIRSLLPHAYAEHPHQ